MTYKPKKYIAIYSYLIYVLNVTLNNKQINYNKLFFYKFVEYLKIIL